jgi:hypothetical protein
MVYGPFGAPKGTTPKLCGLAEMASDHKCTLHAHSLECKRISEQIGVELSLLQPLEQDQKIDIGEAGHFEVLHTPGHSGGSICLCVVPTAAAASKADSVRARRPLRNFHCARASTTARRKSSPFAATFGRAHRPHPTS